MTADEIGCFEAELAPGISSAPRVFSWASP
jgi:hypothetical protein